MPIFSDFEVHSYQKKINTESFANISTKNLPYFEIENPWYKLFQLHLRLTVCLFYMHSNLHKANKQNSDFTQILPFRSIITQTQYGFSKQDILIF